VAVLLQKLEENIETIDERQMEDKELQQTLDKDNNGIISVEEIREFLQSPNANKLTEEQIEQIMQYLDRDRDGQVSTKQLMLELKEAKQILNQKE
jgi:Ca2+-binding EF-hand superfamily protein